MNTSVPTTKPPGTGWRLWLGPAVGDGSAYDYVEVETWREGWQTTGLQTPEANPEMNAYGLWWRPAGPRRSRDERLRVALRLFR